MNLVRAFSAGIVIPVLILPLVLCTALHFGQSQILGVVFLHYIPIIWGVWNALVFGLFQNHSNCRYLFAGALLGILIAAYGVFVLHVPEIIGIPSQYHLLPLVVAPIAYAIFWRFLVKPLNSLLGVL